MKKLLMVVLAFVGITCGALAEPKEYKNAKGELCARVDKIMDRHGNTNEPKELHGKPYSFIRIYFDTASYELRDGCEDYLNQLFSDLSQYKDDVQQVVMFGSADKQGDNKNYNNTALAYNRVFDVWYRFFEEGNGWEDKFFVISEDYVAGSSDATDDKEPNNPEQRSVDFYVIWRQATCDTTALNYLHDRKEDISKYTGKADLSEIKAAIDKLEVFCMENPYHTASDSEEFQRLWADLMNKMWAVINANGSDAPFRTEVAEEGDIIRYYNNLTKMRNELFGKVNVWRNAEGKFNTARLASDSIAGVVLGTAGGLITSHLVKKNQVKTGFEDIQCTVGGQRVADWGDEFMVGIR